MELWFYGTVDGVPIEAPPRDPDSHITVLETSSAVNASQPRCLKKESSECNLCNCIEQQSRSSYDESYDESSMNLTANLAENERSLIEGKYGPLLLGCRAEEPVTVLPQFRPQSQNTVSRGRVREPLQHEKRNPATPPPSYPPLHPHPPTACLFATSKHPAVNLVALLEIHPNMQPGDALHA
ncbi:hypothetical protein HZH66_002513 [Vespula vulgaris]|uniref:Uncharacterized protein n=1 Tax=Vespula vulgaris TaxID=7454 RepID=A0A834KJK6_VESVU|nr:hypothetical protein HZH66_002513 [Vespula vulgaris]